MAKEEIFNIIPKAKPKPPFWLDVVFYGGIFLIILVGLFTLIFWRQTVGLEKEVDTLNQQKVAIEKEQLIPLQSEISLAIKKADDFFVLLTNHPFASGIFYLLRSICHKQVVFRQLSLTMSENHLVLSGQAKNFLILAEQFYYLKYVDKRIKSAALTSIGLNVEENTVDFSLDLVFDGAIFRVR